MIEFDDDTYIIGNLEMRSFSWNLWERSETFGFLEKQKKVVKKSLIPYIIGAGQLRDMVSVAYHSSNILTESAG